MKSWELMGQAMHDYYQGDYTTRLWVVTDFLGSEWMPVAIFFRDEAGLADLERYALSLCQGTVLDLGAGAGCHSLILQKAGFSVTAVDISQKATELMVARGLEQVVCGTITSLNGMKYDTILMLMNGIGMIAKFSALKDFLINLQQYVNPGGQVLLDSSDLQMLFEEQNKSFPPSLEVTYQLSYQGVSSETFHWLYLDQETLISYASEAGWDAQVLYEEGEQFLIRLVSLL